MKKIILVTIFLTLFFVVPLLTIAQTGISVSVNFPPPVVFESPPNLITIPYTNYVYGVPDAEIDLFFWDGWWWRPWKGQWYRSRYYDRGWIYHNYIPAFFYSVDPGWRRYYKEKRWHGQPWHYELIAHHKLQHNSHNNLYRKNHQTRHFHNHQYQPQKNRPVQQRIQQWHSRPPGRHYSGTPRNTHSRPGHDRTIVGNRK
ncbi:MAG: hypothetical protein GX587_02665 [Bacteroidales bacterium]|nr:hypothetical protein [Bacteroidales bacterium]